MSSMVSFSVEKVMNGGFIIRETGIAAGSKPALAAVTTAPEVASFISKYVNELNIPGQEVPPPDPGSN